MAATVRQSKSGFHSYGSGLPYTSISATLDSPALSGSLLLAFLAIDKTSGAISIPTGFTLVHDQSDSSFANGAMAYKKAVGGEQAIGWTWTNGSNSASILIREVTGLPADWTLNGLAENTSARNTQVTSLALSASPQAANSYAAAMACVDGRTRWGTAPSWSNSFVGENAIHHNHTSACSLAVATKDGVSDTTATTVSWTTADYGYAAIGTFGSPASTPPPPTDPTLTSRRLGGISENRIRAAVKVADATQVRLVVSTASNLSSPVEGSYVTVDANGYAKVQVAGLSADTLYFYAFDLVGVTTIRVNGGDSIKTLGRSSFGFAFGSCQQTNASPAIFDAIMARDPEFFLHLGDWWYTDTDNADPAAYRARHEFAMTRVKNRELLGSVPVEYIWSDHDFCGNSSGPYSTGHNAVESAYRQCVASHDLPSAGIYRSFEAGPLLVIMLDTRFARDSHLSGAGATRTLLGATQKQWLKDLLEAEPLRPKVIASDGPWCAASQDNDHWGSFWGERQEIADFINENGIENVVMIGGDVHGLAADDGSNSVGGFPSFQAAPLYQTGRSLAGPWAKGPYPNSPSGPTTEVYQQYGWIDVLDEGDAVTLTYSAVKEDGTEAFSPTVVEMRVTESYPTENTSVGFIS